LRETRANEYIARDITPIWSEVALNPGKSGHLATEVSAVIASAVKRTDLGKCLRVPQF